MPVIANDTSIREYEVRREESYIARKKVHNYENFGIYRKIVPFIVCALSGSIIRICPHSRRYRVFEVGGEEGWKG